MSDFASSALYNLAVLQLKAQGFETDELTGFSGKTEAGSKRQLLDRAFEQLGAHAIISIGQGIKAVPYEPTLEVLRRAVTPQDLLDRWTRLESYYHGNNRVRILETGQDIAVLEHYAETGPAPSAGEDLLIAGLLAALLQVVGCKGLNLKIPSLDKPLIFDDEVQTQTGQISDGSHWVISWRSFDRQSGRPEPISDQDKSSDRLSRLISEDPGRGWKIDDAAKELALSTRSLQRRLSEEKATFQKVLRRARTDKAAQQVLEKTSSLAVIGYACGFSDQAHFNREFKARFNMTPQAYEKLGAEN